MPKGHAQPVGTAQADSRLSNPHPVQATGGTFSPFEPQDGTHGCKSFGPREPSPP